MPVPESEDGPAGCPRKAALFGSLVAFVVFVDLVRHVRPDLLISPEPSWALPRLVLTLFVIGTSAAAGSAAAALFFLWSRTARSLAAPEPVPFHRGSLCAITLAALAFGVAARFAWLDSIPATIWFDEVLPIHPSLTLEGSWRDFRDAIRILPEEGKPFVFSGVLYLEAFRLVFHAFGTTLFALRFPGALAGALSLMTAFLLAATLLPRGGASLAVLVLAGLRWQIILARWGWNGLPLAPIADVALLFLIRARRRSSLGAALAGGLVAGLGAHVYLGAWIVAAALAAFLFWPQARAVTVLHRAALVLVFGLGFLAAVSPIFLLKENRRSSYFVRASDQSLILDMRRKKDYTIPFAILADSFKAPWFIPDPTQDLPKSRLGWIIGIPVGIAFLLALRSPRKELSALLFAHAGAAIAASLRWGSPGHPNGYRFLYLTTITAVAAAWGTLWLVALFPRRRRLAAFTAFGLLGAAAIWGARDALFRWGESRQAFDGYRSESTLVGRAQTRWRRYGSVRLDGTLAYNGTVVDLIGRYILDPNDDRARALFFGSANLMGRGDRCFRIAAPGTAPVGSERRVETLGDPWGRSAGVVLGGRCPPR
jgi:hypothetical protein